MEGGFVWGGVKWKQVGLALFEVVLGYGVGGDERRLRLRKKCGNGVTETRLGRLGWRSGWLRGGSVDVDCWGSV